MSKKLFAANLYIKVITYLLSEIKFFRKSSHFASIEKSPKLDQRINAEYFRNILYSSRV